jgi:hypothetical protein
MTASIHNQDGTQFVNFKKKKKNFYIKQSILQQNPSENLKH